MKRRKFLVGIGSSGIGAGAIIGSGAFSRVEAERSVTVAAADDDSEAYLGFDQIEDSPNSQNYTDFDENGHLEIDIGASGEGGEGVNSNSITWFDNMFQVCNQGKADADVYIEDDDGLGQEPGEIDFYIGTASGGDGDENLDFIVGDVEDGFTVELGTCQEIGVRVNSAEEQADPVFDGEIGIVADSPEAGDDENDNGNNG